MAEAEQVGVLVIVHRLGQSPETYEYRFPQKARVAVVGSDLVISRRFGRVLARYRSGEWSGYEIRKLYSVVPDPEYRCPLCENQFTVPAGTAEPVLCSCRTSGAQMERVTHG